MEAATIQRDTRDVGATRVAAAALILIVLGLLGIWNEVRYQGCVGRIDQQYLVNATAGHQVVGTVACHRVPLIH